jgi:hypothetical protein
MANVRVGEILDFQMQLFSLFTVHFPLFLHEKKTKHEPLQEEIKYYSW